jgi:H/ACA ribonucleoprotein complex subunit 1
MGAFVHAVEDEMLCSSLILDKVPHFNAPIYLENKSMIGKVDEILGPINEVYFSVKMEQSMPASSFKRGDKVYISGDKLLPIERFLPRPKVAGGGEQRSRLQKCSLADVLRFTIQSKVCLFIIS